MRAVGYTRVSSAEQVEGYSLAAQERAIGEACAARGFQLEGIYRDEGLSAHTDRLDKRPGLVRLLDDAKRGAFDVVLVHTLDRWARNLAVALQSLARLNEAKVGLISVTENIDYATGQGRLSLHILAAFAEFFSDNLASTCAIMPSPGPHRARVWPRDAGICSGAVAATVDQKRSAASRRRGAR